MNTKIFGLTVMVIGLLFQAYAQDVNKPEYLFEGNGKVRVSGFGGPMVGFSSTEGNFSVFSGGGGAVLLNQTFFFGGYGMGLASQHSREDITVYDPIPDESTTYRNLATEFGHGGFWLGYIHQSYKKVHLAASSKFGWGALTLIDEDYMSDELWSLVTDVVFVVTPQLEVEMNLFRWFKVNIGAGYRFVTGVDKTYCMTKNGPEFKYFDAKDFNQPELNVTFMFGGFGKKEE
jgi:hypothetical protein